MAAAIENLFRRAGSNIRVAAHASAKRCKTSPEILHGSLVVGSTLCCCLHPEDVENALGEKHNIAVSKRSVFEIQPL